MRAVVAPDPGGAPERGDAHVGTVEAIDATIENRKGFPSDAVRHNADRRNQRRAEANLASPTGLNVEAPGDPHASRLAWGRARRAQAAPTSTRVEYRPSFSAGPRPPRLPQFAKR